MKLHIIVEGQFDKELLELLLKDLPQPHTFVVQAAQGRDAGRPIARKYLLVHREPVVFVFDADTHDEQRARRQQRDFDDYFRWGGHGVPFKVIQFVPELEVIFFEQPQALERFLGRSLAPESKVAGRIAPRKVLGGYGLGSGTDRMHFLTSLTEEDLRDLRRDNSIAEIRAFILEESVVSKAG